MTSRQFIDRLVEADNSDIATLIAVNEEHIEECLLREETSDYDVSQFLTVPAHDVTPYEG